MNPSRNMRFQVRSLAKTKPKQKKIKKKKAPVSGNWIERKVKKTEKAIALLVTIN